MNYKALSEGSPLPFELYIYGSHAYRKASAELFDKPSPRQLLIRSSGA